MDEASWLERHARHLVVAELGEAAVRAWETAHVFVAGAGGLGSPVLLYLAAAGVGQLSFADHDSVTLSNLQRQILYTRAQLGSSKVRAATAALTQLSPETRVQAHRLKLTRKELAPLMAEADVVVDCLDGMREKLELHDCALVMNKPFVYGSVLGMSGQLLTILPRLSACLRCFFTELDFSEQQNCADLGVFGPLCGMVGSAMAGQVLKLLAALAKWQQPSDTAGAGTGFQQVAAQAGAALQLNQLLSIDSMTVRVHPITGKRRPACPSCGRGVTSG